MYDIIKFDYTNEGTDEGRTIGKFDSIDEVTACINQHNRDLIDLVVYECGDNDDLVIRNWRGEEWLAEFEQRPYRHARYLKAGDIFRSPATGLLREVITTASYHPAQITIYSKQFGTKDSAFINSVSTFNGGQLIDMHYPEPPTPALDTPIYYTGDHEGFRFTVSLERNKHLIHYLHDQYSELYEHNREYCYKLNSAYRRAWSQSGQSTRVQAGEYVLRLGNKLYSIAKMDSGQWCVSDARQLGAICECPTKGLAIKRLRAFVRDHLS